MALQPFGVQEAPSYLNRAIPNYGPVERQGPVDVVSPSTYEKSWCSNAYEASSPHPPISYQESFSNYRQRFSGPYVSGSRLPECLSMSKRTLFLVTSQGFVCPTEESPWICP